MKSIEQPQTTIEEYPSIPLAYEYVLPSYEWAIRRSDRMEERLNAAIRGITAVTLAMPAVGVMLADRSMSILFVLAVASYVAAMFAAVNGQIGGKLNLVNLNTLYERWLGRPADAFRAGMIQFAAVDMEDNAGLIAKRYGSLRTTYKLALIEFVFWMAWIVAG